VTLCLAISRGQHMDYSIQKAVELGVNTIVPVISEFSNVKLQADRLDNKMTHWLNIIISAAEQCGRSRLPELVPPVSFSDCLSLDISNPRLILQPNSQQSLQSIELEGNHLSMLIGPEGGFSESEIQEACNKGAISINMGPRILRAETAVVTALSNAQQLWGDLK
jgi:16S rRNA (uracil1498-N3)-methyltransferase